MGRYVKFWGTTEEGRQTQQLAVRAIALLLARVASRRRILLLRKSGHNKFAPLRSKLETHCMGTCVNVDPQSGFTYPETLKDLAKQKSKTVCEIL